VSTVFLQISSGRGPIECAWVTARLTRVIVTDARKASLKVDVMETEKGPVSGTLMSALLSLEGEESESFANGYEGTIQWIGYSRFRPGHKRKNWFVGVQRISLPDTPPFTDKDVRVETMKATGPGGQHVNKTESAVRALHIPTGIIAVARDERSQHTNRKRALERLAALVAYHEREIVETARRERWQLHNELIRGNPVRVYKGKNFTRIF